MNKIKAALSGFFTRVKHVFTRAEAMIKTVAVTAIGGGVTTVGAEIQKLGHVTLSVDQLIALKAHFISGAIVAFIMYLSNFPGFHPQQQMQLPLSQDDKK